MTAILAPAQSSKVNAYVSRIDGRNHRDIVRTIWERVLQQSPIAIDADFFDLGGDSLIAITIFGEILDETGRDLPITTIYDAPTIEGLAALLDDKNEERAPTLVKLKDGEVLPPLFIVHGIGGTVIELFPLGRHISYGGPVYAIQARGLDGFDPPAEGIDDMAASYLAEIEKIQHNGHYVLAGYSFGGLVALEIARLIEAKGGETAFLGFLDTFGHPKSWPLLSRLQVRLRRARHRLSALKSMPRTEFWHYVTRKLRGRGQERSAHGVGALQRRLFPIDMALPLPLIKVHDCTETALNAYRPGYYPGKITFFQPENGEVFFRSTR